VRRAGNSRGHLRGIIVVSAGLAMLVPTYAQLSGARVSRSPAATLTVADTTVDSLLVTDKEYQGWKWFHVYCFRCHGVDAMGSTFAPDLRHSVGREGTVTHVVFVQTVTDGRLPKGMPTWKALLDSTQIEELYSYIKARSEGRLVPGRPHRAGEQ
jgi:mono/diheme cytochrome c family protein